MCWFKVSETLAAGKVKGTISAAMQTPWLEYAAFSHWPAIHGTSSTIYVFTYIPRVSDYYCSLTYRLRVRSLFHEMERFAFMAREWSAGISIGTQTSCNSCRRSLLAPPPTLLPVCPSAPEPAVPDTGQSVH
jgi:hypothetical protein